MKTIKQIADELGIKKDKVKYQVGKLPSNLLVKKGNTLYIKNNGIKRLYEIFDIQSIEKKTENFTDFSHLEKTIELLENQLIQKDKQIDSLLVKLDQEQQLHLLSNQKVNVLELELKEKKKNKWGIFR